MDTSALVTTSREADLGTVRAGPGARASVLVASDVVTTPEALVPNLAQTLLELGCPRRAREQLASVDFASLNSPLREAVTDTRIHVDAAVSQTSADNLPAHSRKRFLGLSPTAVTAAWKQIVAATTPGRDSITPIYKFFLMRG